MSTAKPAFLLAGGRPRDPEDTVRTLSRALRESGSENTAGGLSRRRQRRQSDLLQRNESPPQTGRGGRGHNAPPGQKDGESGAAKKILEDADVIFISGGEVEDGMAWLNRHGLADYIRALYGSGKLFVGMSAGSIMMGAHWVRWEDEDDDATASLFDCLGSSRRPSIPTPRTRTGRS